MKVGSLVIAVKDYYTPKVWYIAKDTILEVRTCRQGEIVGSGRPGIGLRFVGITNGTHNGAELAYLADYFKEIQPPMEVSIEELLMETA